MYGPLFRTNWIEERQQELRRVTEDGRERYEEILRSAAEERNQVRASSPAEREPLAARDVLRGLLGHAILALARRGRPTSVHPIAGSGRP